MPLFEDVECEGPLGTVDVSVVMPAHNSSRYIEEAIDSVVGQSFNGWELIVVDDASTDETVEVVLSRISTDRRIRLLRLRECSGPAVARNHAISNANGRYIAFLDSDDRWLPTKLAQQVEFMQQLGVAFTFSAYFRVDEFGNRIGVVNAPKRVSYRTLLKSNSIGCLTAIYDTEVLGFVDMPTIGKGQDFAMWLKLLRLTDFAYGIAEPLADYRVRSDSISSKKMESATWVWQVLHDVEQLPTTRAAFFFSHYALRGLVVTAQRRLQVMSKEFWGATAARSLAPMDSTSHRVPPGGHGGLVPAFANGVEALKVGCSRVRKRGLAFPLIYFKEVLAFDLRWHTNTAGRALNSEERDENVHYVASFTSTVTATLARTRSILGDRFCDSQFVDVGCGKGKALAVYLMEHDQESCAPPVGIDYDERLCVIARENLEKLDYGQSAATVVCDSALNIGEYLGSKTPMYFLFNPFNGSLFSAFLDAISGSIHVVIYVDPVEEQELLRRGYVIESRNVGRYHSDTWVICSSPGYWAAA